MPTATTGSDSFHDGELAVQQRAGALAQGRKSGRMIADAIIPGAVKFVRKQPFVVLGSVDERQNLWASCVVGSIGFMDAEPRSIDFDLSQSLRVDSDPLWRNVATDPRLGMLVIDLRSRARLRVNGRVSFPQDSRMHVDVEQAYPNCPQYIQRRNYRPSIGRDAAQASETLFGTELLSEQRQWISKADTLFVASEHSTGLDASHRGGNPGFIQVTSPTRLRIPDYSGNGMFNTLGNFALNPRAGIVIPDLENGRTLQLTGSVELLWDVDDPQNETGGTGRYWEFEIDRWIQSENSLPGSTEFMDYSPHNPVEAR